MCLQARLVTEEKESLSLRKNKTLFGKSVLFFKLLYDTLNEDIFLFFVDILNVIVCRLFLRGWRCLWGSF